MRILVVEDNKKLAEGLLNVLMSNQYVVDMVSNGADADAVIAAQRFDLIILDLTLPDMDGLEVLRNLRGRKITTPVLILTARGDLDDLVMGLDIGADDYMVKPFEINELEARIRVLLRRSAGNSTSHIKLGPLILDIQNNTLSTENSPVDISARELNVLTVIMMSPARIIPKNQIAESLSTFDSDISDNAVEQIVSRLRKRLHIYGINIGTARGLGYYLDTEPARNG
ncbi:MAG: response regulator transcription factor [Hyphomicrobiales bacterium]|nr:response regulator transcription factor [Hyphomicrobiales bacterium]